MAMDEIMEAALAMGPAEGLSHFAEAIDKEWIEQALQATGTASCRRRKLPAERVVWLVLGMAMFADCSIGDVVDHLDLVVPGVKSLAPSSVPKARYRLGPAPIEWLFRRTAQEWSDPGGLDGWRGLSLFAVDGTCMRVQDSDENFEHFGKPGGRGGSNDAGYPQLRMACLMNLGTRLLVDACFGPYSHSEHKLAEDLWNHVSDNSITILDRGFVNYTTFAGLIQSGNNRHFMVRMRRDMTCTEIEELPDGSILADLQPSRALRRANPACPWPSEAA